MLQTEEYELLNWMRDNHDRQAFEIADGLLQSDKAPHWTGTAADRAKVQRRVHRILAAFDGTLVHTRLDEKGRRRWMLWPKGTAELAVYERAQQVPAQ